MNGSMGLALNSWSFGGSTYQHDEDSWRNLEDFLEVELGGE